MAKKKYEESNIQAIATAIREKTGTEQTYKTEDMASGVNEVYEAGKQVGIDDIWWNVILNRSTFKYLFYYWEAERIEPPAKFAPVGGSCSYMFANCEKLKAINKELFDLSQADYSNVGALSSGNAICLNCKSLEVFPDIGLQAGYSYSTFSGCTSLHTIEKMRFNTGMSMGSNFSKCSKLKYITVEGTIGQNISFSDSPLLVIESLKSIITHLANFAGTTNEYKYSITLPSACKTRLANEGATAEYTNSEGVTTMVTWAEYINLIGWTLK